MRTPVWCSFSWHPPIYGTRAPPSAVAQCIRREGNEKGSRKFRLIAHNTLQYPFPHDAAPFPTTRDFGFGLNLPRHFAGDAAAVPQRTDSKVAERRGRYG